MVEAHAFEPAVLRSLPAAMGAWEMSVRLAPDKLGTAAGTKLVVVADGRSGMLRAMRVVAEVTEPAVLSAVAHAMRSSASGLIACRPRELAVDGLGLARLLSRPLERCGVKVVVAPSVPTVDSAMAALHERSEDLRGRVQADDTMLPPMGTVVLQHELAEAAARIAKLEPWRYIDGEVPLTLTVSSDTEAPRVLVIFGQQHDVEGVSCFHSVDSYRRGYAVGVLNALWSLRFTHASQLAVGEREAFDAHGLAVVHGLYPHFAVASAPGEPKCLDRLALATTIVSELSALATFLQDSLAALTDGQAASCADLVLADGGLATIAAHRELMLGEATDDLDDGLLAALDFEMSRAAPAALPTHPPPTNPLAELPLLYGGLSHRLMLVSVPRSVLAAARGARVALWRAEQHDERVGKEAQAIVVKMLKRDAEHLLPTLAEIDRVQVRRSSLGRCVQDTLVAYRGERQLGSLGSWVTPLDAPDPIDALLPNAISRRAFVLFVSGGGERWLRILKPQAIVGALYVQLEIERDDDAVPF